MAYSMGTQPEEVLSYHGVGYKKNFMTFQVLFEEGIKQTYLILSSYGTYSKVKDFEASPRRLDCVPLGRLNIKISTVMGSLAILVRAPGTPVYRNQ